jgi:hypothetical protein
MKQFTVIADMVLLRNGEEVFVDVDKWITDDKYLTAIIHEPLPTSTDDSSHSNDGRTTNTIAVSCKFYKTITKRHRIFFKAKYHYYIREKHEDK